MISLLSSSTLNNVMRLRKLPFSQRLFGVGHLFILFGFFCCLLPVSSSFGSELFDLYEGPRALGLGRAMTSMADDYESLYFNPAGLGLVQKSKFRGFFTFDVGLGILGAIDDARDAFGLADDGGGNSAYQTALEILSPYKNKKLFGKGDFGFFWVWDDGPWFLDDMGVGFYFLMRSDSIFHESLNTLQIELLGDAHVVIGKSFSFLRDESLRIGTSVRLGYRTSCTTEADLLLAFANGDGSNPFNFDDDDVAERIYLDGDVGIQYDLPVLKQMEPRVGIEFQNILNQFTLISPQLIKSRSSNEIRIFDRHINVGFSTGFPQFYIFKPRLSFDIRNIGIKTDSFLNRIHLGAEFNLDLFDWWQGAFRFGMDQGYFTAGAYGLLGYGVKGTVDVVFYGREIGVFAGQNADYRLLVQLGFSI